MLGYATFGTNDLPRAAAFYDALLAPLGFVRNMTFDRGYAWGTPAMDKPGLGVLTPFDGQPATVGNGAMVAIGLATPAEVDAAHARALSLGAADEGAPGPRGPGFYAAYFRDLDGNKLNFFCLQAAG